MHDRNVAAGAIAVVRWAVAAAIGGWGVLSAPGRFQLALAIALAIAIYNLPASLTWRVPVGLRKPIIRLALVGDLLAVSTWIALSDNRPAGADAFGFVLVAMEGALLFGFLGAGAVTASLAAAEALATWLGATPAGAVLPLPPAEAAMILAVAWGMAAITARWERWQVRSETATARLTGERDQLQAHLTANAVAREAMDTSEERLRALLGSAPVMLFTVDRAAVVTAIEGEGLRALGRRPGDAVGWSVPELFPQAPDVARGIVEALAGVPSLGTAQVGERAFAMRYAPLRDRHGQIRGATGVAFDVTERTRAEETLDEQGQLAQALVDAQSDLGDLVIVSEDAQITYANEAAAMITGYEQDELVARASFYELAPAAARAALEEQRARRTLDEVTRFEVTIRNKDGAMVDLEMAEIEVTTGGRRRLVTIGRDITERRRAEHERQALIGRLLAAEEGTRQKIAQDIHDDSIQTLFAAQLRLRMLEGKVRDPEGLAALNQLSATIDRSIENLRDLLFDLRPTALDADGLAAALRLYLGELKKEAGTKGIVIDRCAAEADPDTRVILYRIAQEALANIRKHAAAKRIDVTLQDRDGGVLLTIRDDGRGFNVEDVPLNRPGHLGLQAIRERAEMAHGRLAIQSVPGGGTTVEVWIPRPAAIDRAA
jgi:PAS domain S-box-containing protein